MTVIDLTEGNDSYHGYYPLSEPTPDARQINGLGGNDMIIAPSTLSDGSLSHDTVNGGNGNDALYGLSGNDSLNGDADDDSLDGGKGSDTLSGGTGEDTYVLEFLAGEGHDHIVDVDGTGSIVVGYTTFNPETGETQPVGYALAGVASLVASETELYELVLTDTEGNSQTYRLQWAGPGSDLVITNTGVADVSATVENFTNGSFDLVLGSLNAGPVATDDTVSTVKGVAKVIDVLGNDADPDGTLDAATVTVVDNPANGTVSVNPTTGAITYTPATGYSGPDSFTYTVKDNNGEVSNIATVSIDVAAQYSYTLTEGDDVFSGDSLNLLSAGIAVNGLGGDDYIVTSNRVAQPDVIEGGEGNDLIFTGAGNDYVDGGAGDDVIHARAGNETVIGGSGDDTFVIRFTDAGTTTITDDDGALWHGTFRPATYPASWSPAPGPSSGFAIGGTATFVSAGVWELTVPGSATPITLGWTGGDLTMTRGADAQTVVIKDYVNGTFGITLESPTAVDDHWYVSRGTTAVLPPSSVLDNDLAGSSIDGVGDAVNGSVSVDASGEITFTAATSTATPEASFKYALGNGGGLADEGQVSISLVKTTKGANNLTVNTLAGESSYIDALGGNDTLAGGAGRDRLLGGDGNDKLFGLDGADMLLGGAGNDELDGGSGIDVLAGGAGNDKYRVDDANDVIEEVAGEGGDLVWSTAASYTLSANVENLRLVQDAGDIDGTGNSGNNALTGSDGDNTLSGLGGKDVLKGLAGNDTLLGGADNDKLDGGLGIDVLKGGDGDDTYWVDDSGDAIEELANEGADVVYSAAASYALSDNVEDLILVENAGDMDGSGNDGANSITGNDGNNALKGLDGKDSLFGEGGADRIEGGLGADILFGGSGADTFVYAELADSSSALRDRIQDFLTTAAAAGGEHDTIDLSSIDADTGLAGDQAFDWIGSSDFSGVAGQLHQKVVGQFTMIEGDVDGDGVADFQIALKGVLGMQIDDFIL
ncbi:MAG: cadherin-like domain-containing protein [Pseudorhodoplanes sp.]|nr:cadherin-like domain-containing protein [Pseudorhodoplanes sp.]